MREVVFEDGKKIIKSPWLRIDEAAVYCGMSRSAFDDRAKAVGLPHGGNDWMRLYHVDILDKWLEGKLDVPFPATQRPRRRTIRLTKREEDDDILVNPVNGKIY